MTRQALAAAVLALLIAAAPAGAHAAEIKSLTEIILREIGLVGPCRRRYSRRCTSRVESARPATGAARQLIAFLKCPRAAQVIRARGMSPE